MNIYLQQIRQLVALQRIDFEILRFSDALDIAPKEVKTLEEAYCRLTCDKTQTAEKIALLKNQHVHLEQEIEENNLKLKKSKNKLMAVSNTKEYHAMMREIDGLEKLNRLREEEKNTLTEELEQQVAGLATLKSKSAELKAHLDTKQASLTTRIEETRRHLKCLAKERQTSGKSVPPPVLSRYEFIRSRLAPPVIVQVEQGVCAGCHISIPPQSFIELQKGQQILSCPNCQRLIYWCEHFTPSPG